MNKKAKLVLEDGSVFEGISFGASGEVTGELVFNTSMTGYQEILSDPSYCGQMVVMTYPLIGNYGVNDADLESIGPQVAALIVKEVCRNPSNWRSVADLPSFLERHGVLGVEGLDTRQITRHIRDRGAMRAILSTGSERVDALLEKVRQSPKMEGANLTDRVTCAEPYQWTEPNDPDWAGPVSVNGPHKIAVYDFGVKRNILRRFVERGCSLTVFPAQTPAARVLASNPDGIFLSNGPGDPDAVKSGIQNVRELLGKKPVFGICLGHQILALALGARTYKLKFGHRGGNHPVKQMKSGTIEITAQNHGFAVDPDSLDSATVEMTHVNLYDGTLEGFEHRDLPAFGVQYHPEASPGPHDSTYLFDRFLNLIESRS